MDKPTIVIDPRFAGPPSSANGGYTAGRLAALLPTDPRTGVRVTLRQPPPLDIELTVHPATDPSDGPVLGARLLHGDLLVAEGVSIKIDLVPVEPVSLADARKAETRFAGLRSHPFPTCFVCGPARAPGDGLRLSPGRLDDGRTACTWTPDESLRRRGGRTGEEFIWAALDCPGGWTADLEGRPMVLGQMTAQIHEWAIVGNPYIIVGQQLRADGRKTFTATTLYDADGRILGRAEHLWIAIDPAAFGSSV